MILFVFEGDTEAPIFETIQQMFFPKETEPFICIYENNIYSLYSHIKKYDLIGGMDEVNTVDVLKEILLAKGDNSLSSVDSADVSEIFLFFDYDFQHSRGELKDNNEHLAELLDYFSEETETGKLYINYPMVESLRYTKELPDNDYNSYTVLRTQCKSFKKLSSEFSFYKSSDHLLLSNNAKESPEKKRLKMESSRYNWLHLVKMNVAKANYLCNDSSSMPAEKKSISQDKIFNAQLLKYVNTDECSVSILNSFPIFLYDYFNDILE